MLSLVAKTWTFCRGVLVAYEKIESFYKTLLLKLKISQALFRVLRCIVRQIDRGDSFYFIIILRNIKINACRNIFYLKLKKKRIRRKTIYIYIYIYINLYTFSRIKTLEKIKIWQIWNTSILLLLPGSLSSKVIVPIMGRMQRE